MFGKRHGHQPSLLKGGKPPLPPADRIGLKGEPAKPPVMPPKPTKAAYRSARFLKDYEDLCRRHSMAITGRDGTLEDPQFNIKEGTPSDLDGYFEACAKAHRGMHGPMPPTGFEG